MPQTLATKQAIERDQNRCQWCLRVEHRLRDWRTPVTNYHFMYAGGHHVFRRARVDSVDTIITLCCECHWKVENAKIKNCDMIELLEKIVKKPLRELYPHFHKCYC